jgi:predicted oxidoreductase
MHFRTSIGPSFGANAFLNASMRPIGFFRFITLMKSNVNKNMKRSSRPKSRRCTFSTTRGFLSGKYREGVQVDSVRASGVTKYTNEHGWAVLAKLDRLANHHSVSVSAIALAWLRQQPSVAAPIASARTTDQLREIMTQVTLSPQELLSLEN